MKDILIVTAHPSETLVAEKAVADAGCRCDVITTGVGGMAMSWALQKKLAEGPSPDLIINAGIAGSYSDALKPGDVVMPVTDCFADMGIDDNGSFISVFSANLDDPDRWPFTEGRIVSPGKWIELLQNIVKPVIAATVNMASGSVTAIERIRKAWDPDIETMEGAWFAYVCAMNGIDYFSVRAISNMVEPRNREKWDITLALDHLEKALKEVLTLLKEK